MYAIHPNSKKCKRWLQYTIMKLNSNCSWGGQKYCCHYETILKVNTKEPSTSACVLLWPSFKLSNSDYKINSICVYFKFKCISNQSVHDTTSVLSQRKNIDFMHCWFLKGCNCMITLATKMHLGENLKKKNVFLCLVCLFSSFFSIWVAFTFLVIWWMNVGEVQCFTLTLSNPASAVRTQLTIPTTQASSSCHNNDSLSTQKLSTWLTS